MKEYLHFEEKRPKLFAGVVVALSGIVNNAPGTASPIPAFLVLFGWNSPILIIVITCICALCGLVAGVIGSIMFVNYQRGHIDIPKESNQVVRV